MAGKKKGLSIIDKDLRVEGNVSTEGKLVIAGALEGSLKGNEVVTAEGSRVVAHAKVQDLVVAGEFEGDIVAYRSLRVLRTGDVGGNVVCKDLILEAGGRLNGNVRPLEAEDETASAIAESPSG